MIIGQDLSHIGFIRLAGWEVSGESEAFMAQELEEQDAFDRGERGARSWDPLHKVRWIRASEDKVPGYGR